MAQSGRSLKPLRHTLTPLKNIPELTRFWCQSALVLPSDKGKPDQSQGRKATGPRFLRKAMDNSPKDSKIAEPQIFVEE